MNDSRATGATLRGKRRTREQPIQRRKLAALPRKAGADVERLDESGARFGGREHGAVETRGKRTAVRAVMFKFNLQFEHLAWSNQILKSKIEN